MNCAVRHFRLVALAFALAISFGLGRSYAQQPLPPGGYGDNNGINTTNAKSTTWLVTHDPGFERICRTLGKKLPEILPCKQARLMSNTARVCFAKPAGLQELTCKLVKERVNAADKEIAVLTDYQTIEGQAVFVFRTDADGVDGADTDDQGNIYIEGNKLNDGPGSYEIKIYDGQGALLLKYPIRISPLMSGLEFAPDVVNDSSQTFDPYSDAVELTHYIYLGSIRLRRVDEYGYGLSIQYSLTDNVSNLDLAFSSVTEDPQQDAHGDVGQNPHHLVVSSELRQVTQDEKHKVKWEGLDGTITNEPADEFTMWPDTLRSGVPGALQLLLPDHVVREGDYRSEISVTSPTDQDQVQKCGVRFEVRYK